MKHFCLLNLDGISKPSCERLGQCSSCRAYQNGAYGPRFPVPTPYGKAYIGRYVVIVDTVNDLKQSIVFGEGL